MERLLRQTLAACLLTVTALAATVASADSLDLAPGEIALDTRSFDVLPLLPAGSQESAAVVQQNGTLHSADVVQGGSGLEAWVMQTGFHNEATIQQSGVGNEAAIVQFGAYNQADITQGGIDNLAVIQQLGSGHRASVTQNGQSMAVLVLQYR